MRYGFRAVIIGVESGNRLPLAFMVFRTMRDAEAYCRRQNAKEATRDPNPLLWWTYEPITRTEDGPRLRLRQWFRRPSP